MTPARDSRQAILCDLFGWVFGRGTGPTGEKMAAACLGVDSQDLATIRDPFRVIFADLGCTVPALGNRQLIAFLLASRFAI